MEGNAISWPSVDGGVQLGLIGVTAVVAGGVVVVGVEVYIGINWQPLATRRNTIMTNEASRYFRLSFFIDKLLTLPIVIKIVPKC
jgi:hypothetical protein